MTEEVPAAAGMPECNGSAAPERGPLRVTAAIEELPRAVGTVPYVNADTGPDAPAGKGNQEENRNSLAEDIVCGDFDGEKQCREKPEENDGTLQQGPSDTLGTGTDGQELEEGLGSEGTSTGSGELGTAPSPGEEVVETPTDSAHGRGSATEEEDDEEEEDTEEDEVQVIDMKKESSEVSCLKQPDGSKEASSLSSPSCNSQVEKPGEQPSPGKKNDISRHSYSRYNTISYRRIRKGNTKQRIDEFESMMHL